MVLSEKKHFFFFFLSKNWGNLGCDLNKTTLHPSLLKFRLCLSPSCHRSRYLDSLCSLHYLTAYTASSTPTTQTYQEV